MFSGRVRAYLPPKRTVTCKASQALDTVAVRFTIPYRCRFGQHLRVVGGCDDLGNWDLKQALTMTWTDGDVWTAELILPASQKLEVEYKYVVCDMAGDNLVTVWKPGGNFLLSLPGGGNGSVKVKDAWDEASREVQIETVRGAERRARRRKGVDHEDAVAAISSAAKSALEQLEATVAMSMKLCEESEDPGSPELLAADRLVAAASQRAAAMSKALDVASAPPIAHSM